MQNLSNSWVHPSPSDEKKVKGNRKYLSRKEQISISSRFTIRPNHHDPPEVERFKELVIIFDERFYLPIEHLHRHQLLLELLKRHIKYLKYNYSPKYNFNQVSYPQIIQNQNIRSAIDSNNNNNSHKFKSRKAQLPVLTTGQLFLHSCRHFLGLHLSELTIAIRVNL